MVESAGVSLWRARFPLVSLLACTALVASQLLGVPAAAAPAKLIASSSFIAFAISVGAMRSASGRLLLTGLAFSLLGDMLLLGTSRVMFLCGLAAFLLAHLWYVMSFVVRGVNWRWILAAVVPVTLVSLLVSVTLMPQVPAAMHPPVWAYTTVISIMVMTSIGARGAGATIAIPMGALLFYFSDLSVAAGQFLRPAFPNYVWGLPFYYCAQLLLAWSCGSARQSPATGVSEVR